MNFQCCNCNEFFVKSECYFEHLKLNHKNLTRFDCMQSFPACRRVFSNLKIYIRHINRDHTIQDSCGETSKIDQPMLENYCRDVSVIEPQIIEDNISDDFIDDSLELSGLPIFQNQSLSLVTLNIKNQFKIANIVLNYNEFCNSPIVYGPLKKLSDHAITEFKLENIKEIIFETKWLNFFEAFLKPEMVICTHCSKTDEPIFALIKHIIKFNSNFFLCLKGIETLFYNNHFASYEVDDNIQDNTYFVKALENIKILETSKLNKNAVGKKFVIWDY